MTFKQRNKIALKVFNKICGDYSNNAVFNDICLSNDIIIINGAPLYFNDILEYYNRLQEAKQWNLKVITQVIKKLLRIIF